MLARRLAALALALALPGLLFAAPHAAAQDGRAARDADVVMVLDASNSMWGRIDGEPKIAVARRVIGDLIDDWDSATHLGLVAYGHRREGDCTDIETVVPVGEVDPPAFARRVEGLMPRGRTPLTAAVRRAAELLRYADRPATVILLSDGIETCNADPCALAEELERGGVAFTAHVVGFDVTDPNDQAQLSCLADNTGGQFLTADSADELAEALRVVSAPPAPPADALITLAAVDAADGRRIEEGLTWRVVALDTEETLLAGAAEASPALSLPAGTYVAVVERDGRSASAEFDVIPGRPETHELTLEAALPEAGVDGPPSVEAGADFEVSWQGPDGRGDYVTIVEAGAADGDYGNYTRTREGNPLVLRAPDETGAYELRYMDAASRTALAAAPIAVEPAGAALDAPPSVGAGADFRVSWEGPDNRGDFITVVEAGAAEGEYGNYTRTHEGNPLSVRAPDQAGDYELRYLTGQTRATLAAVPIAVTEASASLEAPPSVGAGSDFRVTWQGPDTRGDFVTIVEAGAAEGEYGNYTRTHEGNPLSVRAPDEAGDYELRYLTGQTRATLAALPIAVTPASAGLDAPPEVVAGADFRVSWEGPDNRGDFVTIVEAGAGEGEYGNYTRTREGDPLSVRAPDEAGDYELRYLTGQTRATLAAVPIAVAEATASLEAPAVVEAGGTIEVTWQGPDNRGDFVTVVEAGTAEGEYGPYTRTGRGSPLELDAPEEPGAYELRYLTGQTRATLAARPIVVE
jgi:Ca-activated chloride channel family protein